MNPREEKELDDDLIADLARLCAALETIAQWGSVNLSGEYEHGLRDIIRSMADCAAAALAKINK